MAHNSYYRPEWTCGRYNAEHRVALMYNLIGGTSNFFEDYSADVISHILNAGRNGKVDAIEIANATGIDIESIRDFFQLLIQNGLLCTCIPTKKDIAAYRSSVCQDNIKERTAPQTTQEKLPIDTSNAEQAYYEAVDDGSTITSVMFELTYNCSEKCVHCYNPGATRNDSEISHRGDREELQLDDYRRIIDDLCNHGLVKVCLSGGDPFSKPIVWDIIDYLYQKEVAFDIFTNGQRIVDKVDCLVDYYPRLVGVSIYSGIPEDHDVITRVPESWEKSMKVVKRLSELAVPMNIKCCVMQPNLHSYYLVNDLARSLGAQPQFEINISDSNEGDRCARSLRLTEEQLQVVLRDDNIPMYVGPEAPNYGGQPRKMDVGPCGAGSTTFCISPEGNLKPCCSFPMTFGNLRENDISEILHGNDCLTNWRKFTLQESEECGQHDYCRYCNLCPGLAWSEHGDYRKASENCCYMAKVRHRLAHRMMEGYDPLQGNELVSALKALPKTKVNLQRNYDI